MKRFANFVIVGVDTGNYNTKTATQCFVSGYKSVGAEAIFEDVLEFEGKHYALSGERVPVRTKKTENSDFLILTMFAAAKELTAHGIPNGTYDLALAIGLPPGFMSMPGHKKELQDYYSSKLSAFQYNGQRYHLNTKKVYVCPQGYAGLLAAVSTGEMRTAGKIESRPIDILAKEAVSLLIDIGGGTVDIVGLENGKPKPEYHLSLQKGLVDVYNAINSELRGSTGNELDEPAINAVLNGNPTRVSLNEQQVIRRHIREYANSLLLKLKEYKLPLHSSYVLVMGGGSKSVKDCWRDVGNFGKLDFLDDIRANAQGFEEMALNALNR